MRSATGIGRNTALCRDVFGWNMGETDPYLLEMTSACPPRKPHCAEGSTPPATNKKRDGFKIKIWETTPGQITAEHVTDNNSCFLSLSVCFPSPVGKAGFSSLLIFLTFPGILSEKKLLVSKQIPAHFATAQCLSINWKWMEMFCLPVPRALIFSCQTPLCSRLSFLDPGCPPETKKWPLQIYWINSVYVFVLRQPHLACRMGCSRKDDTRLPAAEEETEVHQLPEWTLGFQGESETLTASPVLDVTTKHTKQQNVQWHS